MSIIRAPRPEANFYMLNKSISEDGRLSWAARGLLVFLLGKPDHWAVSVTHLRNETAKSSKTFLGKAEMRRAARLAAEWGVSVEDEIWYAAPTQKQARRVFWRRLKQAIPREWRECKTVEVDGKQYAVIEDGKPVYTDDDGKDVAFDAVGTRNTITRLNAEAKSHRERADSFEKTAKAFEGIEDAAAAKKALEIVANLDAKKLVDAGEIEKVKGEISKAFQTQLDEANGKAQAFEQQLYAEKIGGSFARSQFIAEKMAVPADMVQAAFGSNFKIEEGKVVAYDAQGQKIFSRARPGELADFNEALETLVSQYPHRDHILKSSGANGGGAPNGGGQHKTTKGNFGGTKAERLEAIKGLTASE